MTQLYLIRHGQNVDGQVNGIGPVIDLGLTELGRSQVQRLCTRLSTGVDPKADVLLSSPERRAAETAAAIATATGLRLETDVRLEEWRSDDGTLSPEEFMSQWRGLRETERAYHRFQPQSESQAEFFARVGGCLSELTRRYAGKAVLIVTHGGFIQASYRHFFGFGDAAFRRASPACHHTAITLWREESSAGRWVLEYSNDHHHLTGIDG